MQEIKNDVEGFQFIPSTKVNNFGNQREKAKLFNSLNLISRPSFATHCQMRTD